ncbi:MAG TPA: phage holin family protein [Candidatus Limnocylindria bacterium]|nr:phage holin family protein [Candidatus Limnocylindria bacterium]
MTTGDVPPRRESAFTLVRRLVSGTVELAKLEAQRGRQEITENVVQYRNGVILLAIGFGFAILAVIMLMILFVVGLAALTGIPAWVIALVFLVVLLAVAGLLAWRGVTKIGDAKFTPDETMDAVKEDIEWAKSLLRRG